MTLLASVIIPTFNRAGTCIYPLTGLTQQTVEPSRFEILVVDNNSTDNTRDVIAGFAGSHSRINVRIVTEPMQGASYARNRGILEAHSEFVCFLDDDTVPSPGWLENLLGGFDDAKVGVTGGPIVPDYQGRTPPGWLAGDLQGMLGGYALPYASPTAINKWTEFPFGGNIAFRKEVFANVSMFRVDLDRVADRLLAGGETELVSRVHAAGWRVMYIPGATVRHLIPPSRMGKPHVYRIGLGLAATHVVLTHDRQPAYIARWFFSDLWYASRMLYRLILAAISRKKLWFDDYMRFWIILQRMRIRLLTLLYRKSSPVEVIAGLEEKPTR